MTIVRFEPSGVEALADAPSRLMDIADDAPDSDIPFSCRAANCGTCRVEILEGAEALDTPGPEELEIMEIFGDGPRVRLCCQALLERDVDRLVLRVIDS